MLDQIEVVPAGAGSGKTHHIMETLTGWITAKVVAPERILAVTFTETAATELRSRLRAALLRLGRMEDAIALDRAYIGTIHAIGQRILTENAFAAGRSPEARVISDAERQILLRRFLGRADALEPLRLDPERYGFRSDWGISGEARMISALNETISVLSGLGDRAFDGDITASALARLDDFYGAAAKDGEALGDVLQRVAAELLIQFPNGARDFANTGASERDFRDNLMLVRRAAERRDDLSRDWALWQKLRNLRLSNTRTKTPNGYDEAAQTVMDAAARLVDHPGPLTDARARLTALVTGAQEVLRAYENAKREAGLVDYSDMIAGAERLLRESPQILSALSASLDCVVIDEFQDTNPIQFALLWRIAGAVPRTLIVGDRKQAIMGFQGATPTLQAAVEAAHPEDCRAQDTNWRSDARIMAFVNALGRSLFGEGYQPLVPKWGAGNDLALEAIEVPGGRASPEPEIIAEHIEAILAAGTEVAERRIDPETGETSTTRRRARPEDIAVIAGKTKRCADIADSIRGRGFIARMAAGGWRDTEIVRVARFAAGFAADPGDIYSGIGYATLGPPSLPLRDALAAAMDEELKNTPGLAPLVAISAEIASLDSADALSRVIAASGLDRWAEALPEAYEARADLLRLRAEAQAFDDQPVELRTAVGLPAGGLQAFLGWIAIQDERDFDARPAPDGQTGRGIEVTTWHKSKGREWPIVVVAGLDWEIGIRPGTLATQFGNFDDLGNILAAASLDWMPDFDAPENMQPHIDAHEEADEEDVARLIYVATTRAKDRLIMSLPAPRSNGSGGRAIDWLRDTHGLTTELDGHGLRIAGASFPARITTVPKGWTPSKPVTPPILSFLQYGTLARPPAPPSAILRRSPSSEVAPVGVSATELSHFDLGTPVRTAATEGELATDRGTRWHLALRVLLDRPDRTEALLGATGLLSATVDELAAQARALDRWLSDFGYPKRHLELPIQLFHEDGSETNAVVDWLAEGPDGYLIVDHKSGPCPDPEARFAGYQPQLEAYLAAVETHFGDKPVRGLVINWVSEGRVSLFEVQPKRETA